MGMLASFERLLEYVTEGPVRRWFRPPLQPVHLAKSIARAMDRGLTVGAGGPVAPNAYKIRLHPTDHLRFQAYAHSLAVDLASYVNRLARERGARLISAPQIELIEDVSLAPRTVAAEGRLADVEAPAAPDMQGSLHPFTLRLPQLNDAQARTVELKLSDGRAYHLAQPVVRIGRGVENDVVISDGRVSRGHAELRASAGQYLLVDLGSTNGTWVNGSQITEQRLPQTSQVSLGGYELCIRLPMVDRGSRDPRPDR